jgi:hypothetical protein
MTGRPLIAAVGASMLGMALLGLTDPSFYLGFIGYSIADPAGTAFAMSEIRAIYGGLFAIIGAFTLLSAIDPLAHRSRLAVLAWCWLGIGGGRLLGVMLDGSPGPRGFGLLALELIAGALLLACVPAPADAARARARLLDGNRA